MKRLVIINDKSDPCTTVLRGVRGTIDGTEYDVETGKLLQVNTDATMTAGDECGELGEDDAPRGPTEAVVALDDWQPSGSARWLTRAFSVEGGDAEAGDDDNADEVVGGSGGGGEHHDVSELYRVSCLMALSVSTRGKSCAGRTLRRPTDCRASSSERRFEPGGRRAL